ncbi:hypothetical protein C8R48DRAFT_775229 [Suillus tomentosus]|nr:hypothetical protein C8R48DRAFT_775229 [Suillus tomentosus]
MAHRRHVSFESSGPSESECASASSRKTSPTFPVEISAPSTEPLKGEGGKRKSSGSDNDNNMKSSKCPRLQIQDNEEPSNPEHTQDPGEMHLSGVQQVVITAICATDLTLGLQWIPAGFHAVIKADGAEFQTSNKYVNVDQTVVEWHERILLPCDPCSKVQVPWSVTENASAHSRSPLENYWIAAKNRIPKEDEVVSGCTSLFMTVEQQLCDQNDTAVLCPLTTLTYHDMDVLALETNAGHRLLA